MEGKAKMSLGQIINFKIIYVACILFLLDSAVLERHLIPSPITHLTYYKYSTYNLIFI